MNNKKLLICCLVILMLCECFFSSCNKVEVNNPNSTLNEGSVSFFISEPEWKPNVYLKNTASYKIEKKTYSINDIFVNGEIFYPFFFNSGKEFDMVNNLILNTVEKFYENWTDRKTKVNLYLDYDVTLAADDFISIVFRGFVNNRVAAHPSNILFTLNIKPNWGKISIYDIVDVNEDFFEYVNEVLVNLDNAVQRDYILSLDMNEIFLNADSEMSSVYTYYDADYMYIDIAVPHAIGDFVELKIGF